MILVFPTVIVLLLGLARWRLRLITVTGRSMTPTLADGRRLLVVRRRRVRAGDVVVFRMPPSTGPTDLAWLVKRAVAVPGDPVPPDLSAWVPGPTVPSGQMLVRGDNPHSADSRTFGLVPLATILGTPLRPLPPP
ncbi:S26 family signal peptidase [Hamadaea tsunoensis]|uniref:S26 family signal peptidase n=1 Tax=Hamadaea tsunoensis TaxID=53368 RepID=UPI00041316DD|nr:S26 family signal peptidase [Hamadaea tsunoensis]